MSRLGFSLVLVTLALLTLLNGRMVAPAAAVDGDPPEEGCICWGFRACGAFCICPLTCMGGCDKYYCNGPNNSLCVQCYCTEPYFDANQDCCIPEDPL